MPVSLIIVADGRVSDCTIIGSSGSAVLDDAGCRGMMEYECYNPALNESSTPVGSTTNQTIRYALPNNTADDMVEEAETDTKATSEIERYGRPID